MFQIGLEQQKGSSKPFLRPQPPHPTHRATICHLCPSLCKIPCSHFRLRHLRAMMEEVVGCCHFSQEALPPGSTGLLKFHLQYCPPALCLCNSFELVMYLPSSLDYKLPKARATAPNVPTEPNKLVNEQTLVILITGELLNRKCLGCSPRGSAGLFPTQVSV